VKPSPTMSKSARGYSDFRMPSVKLDAFLIWEGMTSWDRVGNLSRSGGAQSVEVVSSG
jgi:hypothetical protein